VQAEQELESADPTPELDTQQHFAQTSHRVGESERQERDDAPGRRFDNDIPALSDI